MTVSVMEIGKRCIEVTRIPFELHLVYMSGERLPFCRSYSIYVLATVAGPLASAPGMKIRAGENSADISFSWKHTANTLDIFFSSP